MGKNKGNTSIRVMSSGRGEGKNSGGETERVADVTKKKSLLIAFLEEKRAYKVGGSGKRFSRPT